MEEFVEVRQEKTPAKKGNSPAAMAGRAAKVVRKNNRRKVAARLLSQSQLRRWAKSVEADCRINPWRYAMWRGVTKTE
jgi:hypothetical protein